jgi:hypothetical protein
MASATAIIDIYEETELGDVQVHFVVEHGTIDVAMELCWVRQPLRCPDPRWVQCEIDPRCYRGRRSPSEPHEGDCWLPRLV